jgi:hypothetical protein
VYVSDGAQDHLSCSRQRGAFEIVGTGEYYIRFGALRECNVSVVSIRVVGRTWLMMSRQ